ncbi:pyridoxamine 5'-phosphate oxidase family protein [Demequina capsici]|uniref:Pyridoxamine 5'-phosphate oxidase n=1 Tax=Demequina capsici TaxID=3075620 RepID=A0AA96J5X5_9MICO|nr:pyridoxamine 5'-phosphate oxidase family protein [Demequina sp. OYTSA14]WNM23577.1 hypothetical protein RN606_09380 [Demequina sp. OYTSA14]
MTSDGGLQEGALGTALTLGAVLDEGGAVLLMTSRDLEGALRTRPVSVFWDTKEVDGPAPRVYVFTSIGARKADELEANPEVTLGGPLADGWFAGGGAATVVRSPEESNAIVERVAPDIPVARVTVLILTLNEARRWIVRSSHPFDNDVEQLLAG